MSTFEVGDKVKLEFSGGHILYATVKHVPENSWELWEFDTIYGTHIAINTNNEDFVSMTMEGKKSPKFEKLND